MFQKGWCRQPPGTPDYNGFDVDAMIHCDCSAPQDLTEENSQLVLGEKANQGETAKWTTEVSTLVRNASSLPFVPYHDIEPTRKRRLRGRNGSRLEPVQESEDEGLIGTSEDTSSSSDDEERRLVKHRSKS
jgi:hypothetical protein